MKKPSVTLKCPANQYTGPNERIVEFSFGNGMGGLISLRELDNGKCRVEVYQTDEGVQVIKPKKTKKV